MPLCLHSCDMLAQASHKAWLQQQQDQLAWVLEDRELPLWVCTANIPILVEVYSVNTFLTKIYNYFQASDNCRWAAQDHLCPKGTLQTELDFDLVSVYRTSMISMSKQDLYCSEPTLRIFFSFHTGQARTGHARGCSK